MKLSINTLLIIIIGILVIAAITNPSEDQFINYLENKINQQADTKVEIFLNELLGKAILKTNTQRRDYIFFSKFTVSKPEDTIIYIGSFNNLFFNLK